MKATIKQVRGLTLVGKAGSNHWVPIDTVEELEGQNAGTKPLELVLLGLGGCTGMDVISILKKMRSPIKDFEMELEAEQAPQHPKVFTRIKMKYIFYGDKEQIKSKDIERAIQLSESTYCPVSNMLGKILPITREYEIRDFK
jgi:putative redox protein